MGYSLTGQRSKRLVGENFFIRRSGMLIKNKMIFEYILFKMFGERKMVLNTNPNYYLKDNTNIFNLQINGDIDKSVIDKLEYSKKKGSNEVYYQINDEVLNFQHYDYYKNDEYAYETKSGDLLYLSIPFKHNKKTGQISGVSVDVKSIDFGAILDDILNKEYVDIDYEDYYKLIKFNHFDFRINSSNKLTLGNPININKKNITKPFKINKIKKYSIFAELVNK